MKKVKWLLLLAALALIAASLPWVLNACGGSSGNTDTTHTMTLKGATS